MSDKLMNTTDLTEIKKILGDNFEGQEVSIEDIIAEMSGNDTTEKKPVHKNEKRTAENTFKPENNFVTSRISDTDVNDIVNIQKESIGKDSARRNNAVADKKPQAEMSETAPKSRIKSHEEVHKTTVSETSKPKFRKQDTSRFITGKLDNKGRWRNVIGDTSALTMDYIEEQNPETSRKNGEVNSETIKARHPKLGIESSKRRVKSLKTRMNIVLVLGIIATYISLAMSFDLPLNTLINNPLNLETVVLLLTALQVIAMVVALDVSSMAIYDLFRGKPEFDSLAVMASISTIFHSISIVTLNIKDFTMPLTAFSILALYIAMMSWKQKFTSKQRTYRVCSLTENPIGVFAHEEEEIIAVKEPVSSTDSFLEEMQKGDLSSSVSRVFVPIILFISTILSIVLTFLTAEYTLFFGIFSSIISASAIIGLTTSSSLSSEKASRILSAEGVAVVFSKSTSIINETTHVALTDKDLFPEGTITVEGMKIYGNNTSELVLSYVAGLLDGGEIELASVFHELLKEKYGKPVKATNVNNYETGGLSGDIGSDEVFLGTASFMHKMCIPIPSEMESEFAIYVTVNRELVAIFALKYRPSSSTYVALQQFFSLRMTPVLAMRNFAMTSTKIERLFELRRGYCEFPSVDKRIKYSKLGYYENSLPSAILARDNIQSLSTCIFIMEKVAKAVRSNILIGTLGSIIGVILISFLVYEKAFSLITPQNILMYSVLWSIPSYFISKTVKN